LATAGRHTREGHLVLRDSDSQGLCSSGRYGAMDPQFLQEPVFAA